MPEGRTACLYEQVRERSGAENATRGEENTRRWYEMGQSLKG